MSGLSALDAGVVLAHGSGAPEALTIGLPILALVAFVVFEKRARDKERNDDQ